LELLVLGPMLLRNGRRIIADATHPTSYTLDATYTPGLSSAHSG